MLPRRMRHRELVLLFTWRMTWLTEPHPASGFDNFRPAGLPSEITRPGWIKFPLISARC